MNVISYQIKSLPRFLVSFQAAIYRNILLAKCRRFWPCRSHHHLQNLNISFNFRESIRRILLIVITALLLKGLEESGSFTVAKSTHVC